MRCANCGSANLHIANGTSYNRRIKSLRYPPDDDDMIQKEEHEFYSDLTIKIFARFFFCSQKSHPRIDLSLF